MLTFCSLCVTLAEHFLEVFFSNLLLQLHDLSWFIDFSALLKDLRKSWNLFTFILELLLHNIILLTFLI